MAEQEDIKKLVDEFGAENLVVVLGLNEPRNLRIMASTFRHGDPSYAGVLGGVALGLDSYHIFELKDQVPSDVWESEMAFHELEVEDEAIAELCEITREVRAA